MPELPDLQVFGRNLSEKLVGKRVQKMHAIYRKRLMTSEPELARRLEGAALTSVYRDGKELHFGFDNGQVLGLHMMLKGELHLFEGTHKKKYPIIGHDRLAGPGAGSPEPRTA
jgi:formamidopyrimidine-DNA glycosylase